MAKLTPSPQKVAGYVAQFALEKLPQAAAPRLNSAMLKLMDMAIDGVATLPSCRHLAAKHLEKRGNVPQAVDSIVRHHTAFATLQGVVTNIGGIVSTIIGTPVNVTGLIVVQVRMVACIAHLHGYNVEDPRVRTAIAMCLLGDKELERQIAARVLPTTPAAVATSPVFDPRLHAHVADRVLGFLLAESAGKGLVTTIARRTPVIGGGVGGVSDFLDTRLVSKCARRQLHMRRPVVVIQQYSQPMPQAAQPHSAPQYTPYPG